MASQLELGEVGEGCPLIRNAVQAYMPVIVALLSSDTQLLQLHRHDKSANIPLKLEHLPQAGLKPNNQQRYHILGEPQRLRIRMNVLEGVEMAG